MKIITEKETVTFRDFLRLCGLNIVESDWDTSKFYISTHERITESYSEVKELFKKPTKNFSKKIEHTIGAEVSVLYKDYIKITTGENYFEAFLKYFVHAWESIEITDKRPITVVFSSRFPRVESSNKYL